MTGGSCDETIGARTDAKGVGQAYLDLADDFVSLAFGESDFLVSDDFAAESAFPEPEVPESDDPESDLAPFVFGESDDDEPESDEEDGSLSFFAALMVDDDWLSVL